MKKKVETLVHLASMTEREVYAGRHKLCEQKSAHVEYRLRVSHRQTKKSHIKCFCCVSCVDIYLHVLITVVKLIQKSLLKVD